MRSKEHVIQFNKLQHGLNQFEFNVNDEFLAEFEYSPQKQANILVKLDLLKRENMFDLQFHFEGNAQVLCDTCLVDIQLPVHADFGFIIKLGETVELDDPEIVYLSKAEIEYDLKQFLYESTLLALPSRKGCDELPDPKPCDQEVLKKIQLRVDPEDDEGEDPRWNQLKDLIK